MNGIQLKHVRYSDVCYLLFVIVFSQTKVLDQIRPNGQGASGPVPKAAQLRQTRKSGKLKTNQIARIH